MCRSFSEYFNPRPSCEGRHCVSVRPIRPFLFQSTSLLRGTTGRVRQFCFWSNGISIHVPLARDDGDARLLLFAMQIFQSTSLLRGTTIGAVTYYAFTGFQSTSLLRGTTPFPQIFWAISRISIHVPLARDDSCRKFFEWYFVISIHVPLARDDTICCLWM